MKSWVAWLLILGVFGLFGSAAIVNVLHGRWIAATICALSAGMWISDGRHAIRIEGKEEEDE